MGASALRSGALADQRVIDVLNRDFVPVWIDVRLTPLPRLPVWPQVMLGARLGSDNRVIDAFSQGFFLRSVVLTPDGLTVLNPQAATAADSVSTQTRTGYFAYAQTAPQDVLNMLTGARLRFARLTTR